MLFNRLLPLLIPAVIFCLSEAYFLFPGFIYWAALFIIILLFFSLWRFSRLSSFKKGWRDYFITPALFFLSLIVYSALVMKVWLVHFLFLLGVVFSYLYLAKVYRRLLKVSSQEPFTLENLSFSANVFSFFLFSSALYGLGSLAGLPTWLLILFFMAMSFLVFYQNFRLEKIKAENNWLFFSLATLILSEIAWSLSFLPLNYNVLGFIAALCFYFLSGLARMHFSGALNWKEARIYFFLGLISLAAALLSARWL